jgi:hypothetical protein
MVAIVPDDPLECLMRKIGYSVGLEKLLKRVQLLTDLYVAQRRLSYAAFKELVETSYERRGQEATEDFADFYKELHLLQVAWKTAYPLYTLDTLSILRRFLANDEALFSSACKVVLVHAVLEADGDIFLNTLAADFDPMKFKALAEDMIIKKRQPMKEVGASRAYLRKVYDIINIESQTSNRGNRGKKPAEGESRFERRTEPLGMTEKRTKPLADELDGSIVISDDVLRKVPRTRKAWAKDFGLFGESSITEKGKHLLSVLDSDLSMKQDSGCYICWPYSRDLAKIRIEPEKIGAIGYGPWDLLVTIAKGTANVGVERFKDKGDYSEIIALLKDFYRLYQEGNVERGSIRLQLPLYIAQPCLVGLFGARCQDIPPLPEIIDVEVKKEVRRVERVAIRETEGGITFPKLT